MEPETRAAAQAEPGRVARRGRRRWPWAVAVLVVLAAAHWVYWYSPRPRAASPSDSALLGRGAGLPVRLWIPYPHQNLGALEGAVERPDEVLAAAARLLELPPPSIPRLPGIGWPPASELMVAASHDGDEGLAAVRVYPVAAALLRLAGKLASNPWLAGGEIAADGEPARVRWEGRTWVLERGRRAAPLGSGSRERGSEEPLLALVELAEGSPPLPPGRYGLRREEGAGDGEDLVWRLGARRLQGRPEPPPAASRPVLVLVRRRGAAEALLLLDQEGGLLPGLPAAAAWREGGGAAELLPGGSFLASLLGLRSAPLGSGELVATDRGALAAASSSAPGWLPLAEGRSRPAVAFGAWLEAAPAAGRARQVEDALEEVPLLGEAEARRWGDAALLLESLSAAGFARVECWLAEDGVAGELRLGR